MNDMSDTEAKELLLSTDVDPDEPVKKTWENTKPRVQIVQETNIGVYVWQLPDGNFLTDDDANFLSIASRQGDKAHSQTTGSGSTPRVPRWICGVLRGI
jgi:hypothetical protein